ncbi:MAG: hypothetical protein JXA99_04405 [Candidatus Lokiarchaeota archaeon]|nr:hypothetical protein [Candidatus Lokiarchaeota archaeon]
MNDPQEPLIWQTRIKITQAPHTLEEKKLPNITSQDDYYALQPVDKLDTFLMDPFGFLNRQSYGIELTSEKKINWVFYTKAESKQKAFERGYTWLSELKYQFKGLDGIVSAKPIYLGEFLGKSNLNIHNWSRIQEITIPKGILKYKINILEKFITIFYL